MNLDVSPQRWNILSFTLKHKKEIFNIIWNLNVDY